MDSGFGQGIVGGAGLGLGWFLRQEMGVTR
jgi:hypothetical protein